MKHLLLAFFTLATFASGSDLFFSQMENGDRVEITWDSEGCFHNDRFYYEISKSDGVTIFRKLNLSWDKTKPRPPLDRQVEVEEPLSIRDIKGLDLLLHYYRKKKDAVSTTQTWVLLEFFEGDQLVKREKITDNSGGPEFQEIKGLVTLSELARRSNADGNPTAD